MNAGFKDVADKANAIAELFHTPFLTLVWRGATIAFIAISLYAFNAYKHQMISGDTTVQQILTDTAATRALVTSHEIFVQQQAVLNGHLSGFFEENRKSQLDVSSKLSAILQHGTDVDVQLTRLETKVDTIPNR